MGARDERRGSPGRGADGRQRSRKVRRRMAWSGLATILSRALLLLLLVAPVAAKTAPTTTEPSLGERLARTRADLSELTEALAQGGLTAAQWPEFERRVVQLAASATAQEEAIGAQLAGVREALRPLTDRLDALRVEETTLVDALAKLPPADRQARAGHEQRQRELAAERARLDAAREPLRSRETALVALLVAARRLESDLGQAQEEVTQRRAAAQLASELAGLETAAERAGLDAGALAAELAAALALREQAVARRDALQSELASVQQRLAGLGPTSPEAAAEDRLERASLDAQLRRLSQGLVDGNLTLQRAEQLVASLQARTQAASAARLLQREPNVVATASEVVSEPQDWAGFGQRLVLHGTGFAALGPAERVAGLLLLLLGVPLGRRARRSLLAAADRCEPTRFGPTLLRALYASLARHAVPLVVVGVAAALMSQIAAQTATRPPLSAAVYGLLSFLLLRAVLRTFLAPFPPAESFTAVGREREYEVARRIGVLVLVGVFGLALFTAADALNMPAGPYRLGRAAFVVLGSINLSWLLLLLGRLPKVARYGRALRLAVFGLLALAVGAELMGYHNLAAYVLIGVVGTAALSPLLWVARRLADEFLDGLQYGRLRWSEAPRGWLGLQPGDRLPGMAWLRFLAGAGIYLICAGVLLRLWTSPTGFEAFRRRLGQGVTVGSLTLQPDQVIAGLLVFAALMVLSHAFRHGLDHQLAQRGQLDQGARAATATLLGYLAFAVSALVGVTVSGLDLTKFAVVLGALSVGIGFGLQNIVNNFVSGLILLFERPIRVGDWIRVGEVEGYVKKLSVRSTEIQGFDQQETIVPNSDLITRSVVNLTRYDATGRVTIRVGVPSGSDVRLVERLLYEVAASHPALAQDFPGHPLVLFVGFAGGRLEFELRVMLRDITLKPAVTSDLHFAVHDRFLEHQLVIQ